VAVFALSNGAKDRRGRFAFDPKQPLIADAEAFEKTGPPSPSIMSRRFHITSKSIEARARKPRRAPAASSRKGLATFARSIVAFRKNEFRRRHSPDDFEAHWVARCGAEPQPTKAAVEG